MLYIFTGGEQRFFAAFGKMLWEYKSIHAGGNTRKDGSQRKESDRISGLMAEYAVGRLLGACPYFSMETAGDGGIDLTLGDGRTIDVKYRSKQKYDFLARSVDHNDFKADYAALVWPGPDDQTLEFVGLLKRSDFVQYARVDNFGYDDCLAVDWRYFAEPPVPL